MTTPTDPNQPKIKPAAIHLTPLTGSAEEPGRGKHWRMLLIGTGLAVLALLVLAVVFILPDRVVTEPATPAGDATATQQPAEGSGAAPAVVGSPGSPWSDAQLAKQRKETQEILSDMLETQDKLETISVTEWAPEPYVQALRLAEAGDADYRQREFARARENYQNALAEFKRLLQHSETVYAEAVQHGREAIADGDSAAAKSAFQRALLIRPNDADAVQGLARAEVLDQVLGLIAQGDQLSESGRLEEAASVYEQALQVDSASTAAADRLAQSRQRLSERDFTAAMSAGYAALAGSQLEQARAAFQRALRIRPAAPEARDALRQTDNKLAVADINDLLAEAEGHERAERWSEAAAAYASALKLDANLAAAQTGKLNASQRADLDQRLAHTIANPLRLAEPGVLAEVGDLLKRALTIPEPGPRLQDQIAGLQKLLVQARTPLTVTITSDNLTEVTLYKTGHLGRFLATRIDLVPGHYVAVGKRQGYQDVRVEFTVEADKPMPAIKVQCEEKITF